MFFILDPSFAAQSSREVSKVPPEGQRFTPPVPPPVVLPDAPNTHSAELFLDYPLPGPSCKLQIHPQY